MLAIISLTYSGRARLTKELDRDAWNHLRTELPQLDLGLWEEGKEKAPSWWGGDKILIDLTTDGQLLAHYGIEFEVKNFKNTYHVKREDPNSTHHTHIHVAIPNIGLLVIDEVQVLENCCTDELQRGLDAGWRIIAVCPPNGVRRPDYILGRTKS